MRMIQIQLYTIIVLMLSQAAETLDHLTDLGQNVTINCDLDASEVYWILQKQSDSPTVILRSFSNPTSAFHFNKTLKNKYSVQSKHRLVIYNVTVDEIGVYYCMNKDTPPKLSHSTRLNIIEPTEQSKTTTAGLNQTTTLTKQNLNASKENLTHWKTFSLISGLLNAVLIFAVIGLVKVYVVKNGWWNRSENSSGQHNTVLAQTQITEQHQDPNQLQYVAVDFSKLRKNIRSSQDNSTYAALNFPKS